MTTNKHYIVYDLETTEWLNDRRGKNKGQEIHELEISVLGWYNSLTSTTKVVPVSQLKQFFRELKQVNLLVGFNSTDFDNIVIQKYTEIKIDQFPHFDMMKFIQKQCGHRVSLNNLAIGTLDREKLGQGVDAPTLWKQGKIKELSEYAKHDVEITKEIFVHGCKEGFLRFKDNMSGEIRRINTSDWVEYARDETSGINQLKSLSSRFKLDVDIDKVREDNDV